MLKSLNELLGTSLLSKIRGLSHLTVLILESPIKLGQFDLHIVLDIFLLIADNLEYLIFELRLTLNLKLF